ncbi:MULTISPECIES: LamB/YcsF family protein [Marivita]|uniref:5-oxoprolinase subunit A n=1 Tax=Marivita cryptomonadis TaxID=505252 RepID=A0A9Q2S0H5_9RHOB|nr:MULTISPECIES: 5-oxoprolinase subunit PxpA [Marivita]MCR9169655.1 LamB/YcsF family protein [Paracoccaceae bacterium]MBM2320401.1 LamB/YcsF family protein [Marivita cryptomonadis]MBM2329981.1 LamB/YcsF family protein [Marivita cryptomonadis]MBM2339568.1 LamB/YcsF family protein [Marivita cryptomonadis]MBM2344227.1 LamB/YcsF family protein [Marivita cryptomonadis]
MHVDLNADMGESFGPWPMGSDAALLEVITSANVACGFHAGDPDVMSKTMGLAVANDVGIGAHPGFPDLQGFGRRRMHLSHDNLRNLVRYQLGAAQAMARSVGGEVRHLKLHGALANMASEDVAMATACYEGALSVDPEIIIMVLAATQQQDAVEALGCRWAGEIFADRAYNDDATLVDRSLPGAVIHDADVAGQRMVDMVKAGAIITESGKHIPAAVDTICLHGDGATAVQIARTVRGALADAGVTLQRFEGRQGAISKT